MDDLISRQAAIDAFLTELTRRERKNLLHTWSTVEVKHFITEMLEQLPSAQPEQRWIPCSDRLPEESGRYLATRGLNACGALWNRVYIINYSDLMGLKSERIWWQGNVGKSDFERLDEVLAWMPLPEPYKGGKR